MNPGTALVVGGLVALVAVLWWLLSTSTAHRLDCPVCPVTYMVDAAQADRVVVHLPHGSHVIVDKPTGPPPPSETWGNW